MFKRILAYACFILCFSFSISFAQGTSNKGTDFWIAYAGHLDGTDSRLTLFITSEFNANITINAGGTVLPQVTVPANQAKAVVIDPNTLGNVYVGSTGVVEKNKGIHVTSDKPVIVYSHISHSARSAATLVFPTKVLGNDYYTINYTQSAGKNRFSEFTIIGVEDGTEVEIIPSQSSRTNTHPAGVAFKVHLDQGDIYQFQSETDLSGSRIHTMGGCKPIAVFSGSTFTAYCENPGSSTGTGDNLYQQLLPISAWGKKFISAPFYNTLHGSTDIYRIIVANDNTTISVNNSTGSANGTPLANPYAKGSIITFTSKGANVISADKPVSVAQLQTTQACNTNNSQDRLFPGDPEMTILNPIEQTLKDVTVYSIVSTAQVPTNITSHFINIILKTTDAPSLKIDGSSFPASRFTAIDSEYSYLIDDVTQSSKNNPTHRITANGDFVAIAYGYGNVESYSYLAGSDLKNLNQYIEVQNVSGNQVMNDGCVGQTYRFVLRLPYITNSLIWDFGDGNVYTDPSPSYIIETSNDTTIYRYEYTGSYGTSGSHQLSVHAVNPDPAGCDADEAVDFDFNVYDPPEALFSSQPEVCINTGLAFTDQSDGKGRNISSWLWDFGDSTTSTDQNPVHSYTSSGNFAVKLIVTGESGCTSSVFTKSVRVNALPVAEFSYPSMICETKDITFTDQSVNADDAISSRIWDFGDGITDTVTSPGPVLHKFAVSGTYTVTLKVLTDKGCESDPFKADIVVSPMPHINFELPDVCLNDATATFTNKTAITDGSHLTYLWNFGDKNADALNPNTSSSANPSHVYSEAGYYNVTLIVTSEHGCADSVTKKFTVNGSAPKADFIVQNAGSLCSNQPVQFEDNSSVDFGEITKIEWYYDYGLNSAIKETDDDPVPGDAVRRIYSHTYPAFTSPISKNIMVKMIAYSGLSCVSEITKTIVLNASPEIVFDSIPPVCEEQSPVRLTQARELYNLQGTGTYSGNGVSAAGLFDPKAAGPGSHVITYTFSTANGCTDSKSRTITVYPAPVVNAGKDISVLQGGQARLLATAAGSNLKYKWTPSTGLDHNDILTPVASPLDDITYVLTVTSDQGCSMSDAVSVKVLKSPEIPNAFTPNGDGINDTWDIKYLETYPDATVQIFNRYGIKIYSSLGYSEPWDGRMQGKDMPVGTYYYIINPNNGKKIISGSVAIIR